MGLGGISIGSLILIFLIVVLLFGTKRLRNMGEDLGAALKSFRKGLKDENNKNKEENNEDENDKDKTHSEGLDK